MGRGMEAGMQGAAPTPCNNSGHTSGHEGKGSKQGRASQHPPPRLTRSAVLLLTMSMHASWLPPDTQVKVTAAVLAAPMAAVQAATVAASAVAGMHQRTVVAAGEVEGVGGGSREKSG